MIAINVCYDCLIWVKFVYCVFIHQSGEFAARLKGASIVGRENTDQELIDTINDAKVKHVGSIIDDKSDRGAYSELQDDSFNINDRRQNDKSKRDSGNVNPVIVADDPKQNPAFSRMRSNEKERRQTDHLIGSDGKQTSDGQTRTHNYDDDNEEQDGLCNTVGAIGGDIRQTKQIDHSELLNLRQFDQRVEDSSKVQFHPNNSNNCTTALLVIIILIVAALICFIIYVIRNKIKSKPSVVERSIVVGNNDESTESAEIIINTDQAITDESMKELNVKIDPSASQDIYAWYFMNKYFKKTFS